MNINHQQYQYNISEPPFENNPFVNNTLIPYWENFWEKLLLGLNSDEGLCRDELYWQDRITYITHKSNIVAIQFIGRYPLSEFAYSEYAKRYLPAALASEYASQSGYINTLQYLSVDPRYGYRKTGINFASVLMDMSKLQQREMQADKTITVARNEVGIHNLARKIGYTECCKYIKHNVDVSIMQSDNTERHPRKAITDMSDYLWKNRALISAQEKAA